MPLVQQKLFNTEANKFLTERTNFYFVGGTEQQRNRMYYELPTLLDKNVVGAEPITIETLDGYAIPYVLTVDELSRVAGYCNNLGLNMYVSIMGKVYKVQNPKGTAHMYYIGAFKQRETNTFYTTCQLAYVQGTEFNIQ